MRILGPIVVTLSLALAGCKGMHGFGSGLGHVASGFGHVAGHAASGLGHVAGHAASGLAHVAAPVGRGLAHAAPAALHATSVVVRAGEPILEALATMPQGPVFVEAEVQGGGDGAPEEAQPADDAPPFEPCMQCPSDRECSECTGFGGAACRNGNGFCVSTAPPSAGY